MAKGTFNEAIGTFDDENLKKLAVLVTAIRNYEKDADGSGVKFTVGDLLDICVRHETMTREGDE